MRKAVATTSVFFFLAGAVLFLLPACALFHDSYQNTQALKWNDSQKFVGSVRLNRANAESHYELGCYMQERKKHRPAIEEFMAAVEIDPNHVKAYNAMGVSYDVLGDHVKAVEAYKAALNIYPKLDYVLNNLGYSYLLQGRADTAVEHFKMALELDGENTRYRNNLGLAYAKSGRYDTALAEFKESGDEARAHYNIAQLYYREGRYDEAKAHFQEASLLKGPDPEIAKGLKAASSLTKILEKKEEVSQAPVAPPVVAPEPGLQAHDDSGFHTIPAHALSTVERVEIAEARTDEVPVYRAALARVDRKQEMREAVRKNLEADTSARLDEAQALELLSLQAAEGEGRAVPRIKIEVSNGNGVRHMARNVGDFLRGKDVILMYLSNAGHFKHEETKIYYASGYLMEAYRLAQRLPGRQSFEQVSEIRKGNAEVSILIGKDIVPHLNLFKKG